LLDVPQAVLMGKHRKPRVGLLYHKTKILCTVGPAVSSPEKLEELVVAGADAFRLNFSHGSVEMHAAYVGWIREVERRTGVYLPIVVDLPGPKLRVGELEGNFLELRTGEEVLLVDSSSAGRSIPRHKGGVPVIPVEYPTLAEDVKPGIPCSSMTGACGCGSAARRERQSARWWSPGGSCTRARGSTCQG
jgi:pyruvate kinase